MPKPTARTQRTRPTTDALEIMDRLWGNRPGHREAVARELDKLHLGERIRDARELHGLTQERLAAMVGTTQSGIARLEAAEYTNFKLDTLLKIAGALNGRVSVRFPTARSIAKVQVKV